MKSIAITILSFSLIIVSSCKEDEKTIKTDTSGYNHVNGECISVSANAQYKSLSECQNALPKTGQVSIIVNLTNPILICSGSNKGRQYTIEIGLGYSSTDVTNNAFFETSTNNNGSYYYLTNYALSPGIYYYKVTKKGITCSSAIYNTVDTKIGSFTVTAGKSSDVDVSI